MKRHLTITGLIVLLLSCSVRRPVSTIATTDDVTPPSAAAHRQRESAGKYVPVSQELYDEIRQQDSILFAAFNAHDSRRLMEHFSEDLEFYHDKGGLSDYTQTGKDFTQLFLRNETTGLRRDLVPGSMEVYPIGTYGAVETCLHRFCHEENGQQDCGTFKNIMIWRKSSKGWEVTRVISYDH